LSIDYLKDLKNQTTTALVKKSPRGKYKVKLDSNEMALFIPKKKVSTIGKHLAKIKPHNGKDYMKNSLTSSDALKEARKHIMEHDNDTFA